MQMENIFEKLILQNNYFNISSNDLFKTNLEWNLLKYLNDNFKYENNIISTWELDTVLTTNANGEYI
jgi:hypothetical protein